MTHTLTELKYKAGELAQNINRRADYIEAFWKIIDWKAVANRMADIIS